MAKAIEAGVPKLRIEEASAKTQARIDAGKQAVIGVNKYKPVNEAPIDVLKVENSTVRAITDRQAVAAQERAQPERRRRRPGGADPQRRRRQRQPPGAGHRRRARPRPHRRRKSRMRWKKCSGGNRAEIRSITGVYKREASTMSNRVEKVQALIDAFEDAEGRRPRILVAKIGQDGHGPRPEGDRLGLCRYRLRRRYRAAVRHRPRKPLEQAVENDVHIIGLSSLAAAHLTAVPEVKAALKKQGRDDIMIIIGGVVPPQITRRCTRPAPRRSSRRARSSRTPPKS